MTDIKNKKAIFFDFGDTIASTVPTYPDRIRIALLEMGFDFTEEQFFKAFQYADYQIYKNYMRDNEVTSSVYQGTLFSILLSELGISTNTNNVRSNINKKISGKVYSRKLLPGAEKLLSELKKSGYRLAVISNNDGKTSEKCREIGIAKYFELIIDSTKVNKIKPDREIFLLASSEMGIDTKDILHIGDLYGADIMGARNAGIDAVWINNRAAVNYEETDVIEVSNLFELSELFN